MYKIVFALEKYEDLVLKFFQHTTQSSTSAKYSLILNGFFQEVFEFEEVIYSSPIETPPDVPGPLYGLIKLPLSEFNLQRLRDYGLPKMQNQWNPQRLFLMENDIQLLVIYGDHPTAALNKKWVSQDFLEKLKEQKLIISYSSQWDTKL